MAKIKRGVSLYSLQDEYARKVMSLEEIFRKLKAMDVEGIELLSDQMIHGAPHPAEETVAAWKGLMQKYGFEAVCNDIFINSTLYRNRRLTLDEQKGLLRDELVNTQRLGFSMVRLVSDTNPELVEPLLPLAEELGVVMALEVHGGKSFGTVNTQRFVEVMQRLDSPFVGLIIDTGIFCRSYPEVARAYSLALGVSPAVVKYIDAVFESGTDPNRLYGAKDPHDRSRPIIPPADLLPLIKNEQDMQYVVFASSYENTPFETLDEYLPYIKSFHGKFYEMTPEGEEPSIRYAGLIEYLKEKGWGGYICSEYEGNRWVLPGQTVDGLGQVCLHQEMLKRLIG